MASEQELPDAETLRPQIEQLVAQRPPTAREFAALSGDVVSALCWAALNHPSLVIRRGALDYLDHIGDDQVVSVFVAALSDAIPRVRRHAVHPYTP